MEFLEQIQKDRKIAQDLVNNKIASDIGEAFKMIQEKRHMQVKIHQAAEQNIDGSLRQNAQTQQQSSQQAQQNTGNPQTQTTSDKQSSQAQAQVSNVQATQIISDAAERLAKIEEFLQKFDKFFAKFYEDTNAKLNDFSKSINALNFQMEEASRKAEKKVNAKERANNAENTEAEPVKSAEASVISNHQLKGLEESGVRQQLASSTFRQKDGNYRPEDVAVEMIFNNSHNRLTKR